MTLPDAEMNTVLKKMRITDTDIIDIKSFGISFNNKYTRTTHIVNFEHISHLALVLLLLTLSR